MAENNSASPIRRIVSEWRWWTSAENRICSDKQVSGADEMSCWCMNMSTHLVRVCRPWEMVFIEEKSENDIWTHPLITGWVDWVDWRNTREKQRQSEFCQRVSIRESLTWSNEQRILSLCHITVIWLAVYATLSAAGSIMAILRLLLTTCESSALNDRDAVPCF